jgi:hypothetical protein
MNLPDYRNARNARTFARSWDSAEYGAAVQRFRRRARLSDVLGWVASVALILGVLWVVYA